MDMTEGIVARFRTMPNWRRSVEPLAPSGDLAAIPDAIASQVHRTGGGSKAGDQRDAGNSAIIATAWCIAIALVGYLWARAAYNRNPVR